VSELVEITVTVVEPAQELEAVSTVLSTTKLPLGPWTLYEPLFQDTLGGGATYVKVAVDTLLSE
jgi:outer membrane receptor for monomeric catechols